MFASWNRPFLVDFLRSSASAGKKREAFGLGPGERSSFEQCEQGRNIAALERIIKAPNNFGG
jgi:hypothetical protein